MNQRKCSPVGSASITARGVSVMQRADPHVAELGRAARERLVEELGLAETAVRSRSSRRDFDERGGVVGGDELGSQRGLHDAGPYARARDVDKSVPRRYGSRTTKLSRAWKSGCARVWRTAQ